MVQRMAVRPRQPSKFVYMLRIVLFLGVSGVMIWNTFRFPGQFQGGALVFTWVAVAVGILGSVYFIRKISKIEGPSAIGRRDR